MRWALLMAALMAGGAACAGPEESPRRLTVTGSGSVSVAPEIALLATSVMHQDADVTEAQKRADAAVARYLAAARKLGVADADLQASGASIHPQFEWDKTRRAQELVGYRVTREVSLRIRQLDRLGSFLRAAVDAGFVPNDYQVRARAGAKRNTRPSREMCEPPPSRRWDRRARSSRPICTSPSASRARFSTSPA